MQETLFTIGHSTHSQEHFLGLLKSHAITAICDVRSKPYSRMNPQFNREELKKSLASVGIAYVFLGKELGARSDDPCCYDHGKVQYERLAQTQLFREGLCRVREGTKKYRVALMCAEREPLECHRTVLVARYIFSSGYAIQHIHADGRLESHSETLNRLIHQLHLPEQDMFRSSTEIVEEAYRIQGERIAYSLEEPNGATISTNRAAG